MIQKFTGSVACPCCGYPTIDERGIYEICQVCFWEDDGTDDLDKPTGPNYNLTLREAKTNFESFGASCIEVARYVRLPTDREKLLRQNINTQSEENNG